MRNSLAGFPFDRRSVSAAPKTASLSRTKAAIVTLSKRILARACCARALRAGRAFPLQQRAIRDRC